MSRPRFNPIDRAREMSAELRAIQAILPKAKNNGKRRRLLKLEKYYRNKIKEVVEL